MREILFRGKADGTWRDGQYLKNCIEDPHVHVIYNAKESADYWVDNSETIGQYTGLKDKHGTKIFEGDTIHGNIIEHSLETIGEIEYSSKYSAYVNRNDAGDTLLFKINDIEVIGNKYEGPAQ